MSDGDEMATLLDVGRARQELGALTEEEFFGQAPTRWPSPVAAAEYAFHPPPNDDVIVENLFVAKSKTVIVGSSKSRKTWLSVMFTFCLASGRPFLNWAMPKPRRTLYLNLEMTGNAMHERVFAIAKRMDIQPDEIDDRLSFLNLRGSGFSIADLPELPLDGCEVLILDPVYKAFGEMMDENAAGAWADFLRTIDNVIENTGCSAVLVHHDPKRKADEIVNRGSGSGVLGRDADAILALDPHFDDPDALVVGVVKRRFRPEPAFCIRFDEGRFVLAPELSPTVASNIQRAFKERRGMSVNEIFDSLREELTAPIGVTKFLTDVQEKFNIGERRARDVVNLLCSEHGYTRTRTAKGKTAKLYPPGWEIANETNDKSLDA
ncbi:MAG: helicase RepA family protein [Planctomycetota bacterium]|jgi:hypothetical protein|nr:helicase RepA family protein [Planctomycetota bacterium]